MSEQNRVFRVPSIDDVVALLSDLLGSEVPFDAPLSTLAVESLDIVEWMLMIEERYGLEISEESYVEIDLDFEFSPRDLYEWIFAGASQRDQQSSGL
jgi:acyl carrier protein